MAVNSCNGVYFKRLWYTSPDDRERSGCCFARPQGGIRKGPQRLCNALSRTAGRDGKEGGSLKVGSEEEIRQEEEKMTDILRGHDEKAVLFRLKWMNRISSSVFCSATIRVSLSQSGLSSRVSLGRIPEAVAGGLRVLGPRVSHRAASLAEYTVHPAHQNVNGVHRGAAGLALPRRRVAHAFPL